MSDYYNLLKLINKLKYIERHCNATRLRAENPAEHSWSIAMYVWLLYPEFEKEFKKKLGLNKMIKMSLMHDLIEIETSDTTVWKKKERKKQEMKDSDHAKQMFIKYPSEFMMLWKELEKNETPEAKIVNGLDRLSAAFQRLVTRQGWNGIPAHIKDLDKIQLPNIEFSKTLLNIYDKLKKEALDQGLISE